MATNKKTVDRKNDYYIKRGARKVRRKACRIIVKLKTLSKWKKRAIAIALSAAIFFESYSIFDDDKEKRKVYLVDLKDKYESEAILTDKDGNPVLIGENRGDILAITFDKNAKNGNIVEAVLIDGSGQMTAGYIDAKYLDNKTIDKVEVDNELISELSDIGIVVPKKGLYLRDVPEYDPHTDHAMLLEENQNLIVGKPSETLKDNSHEWKESVTVIDEKGQKKLKEGFIASEYIRKDNYDEMSGTIFRVNVSGNSTLTLRSSYSTDSDVIYKIPNGEEVLLIPNTRSYSDGVYDWFYVAVKVENKVLTGYVAATHYKDNLEVNYLTYVREQNSNQVKPKEVDNNSERIFMIVDTSKENNSALNLRENPSTDSPIISKIENGTKVYTYSELIDNKFQDKNGRWWLCVYTDANLTGFVCTDYLKELDEKITISNEERITQEYSFGGKNPYKIEGYYGIDTNNDTTKEDFEKLLSGKLDEDGQYGYKEVSALTSKGFRSYSGMEKPDFAMIKIGASSMKDGSIIERGPKGAQRFRNMQDIVNLCEERGIPYGFYYYSQCTNEEEMNNEVEYMKEMYKKLNPGKFNVFPLAIDLEQEGDRTRIYSNIGELNKAGEDGRKIQTDLLNKEMNLLRDAGIETTTYLDTSSYQTLIKYEELDEQNKKNTWIVECNDKRSSEYEEILGSDAGALVKDSVIRQICLNQSTLCFDSDGNVVYPVTDANENKIVRRVHIPSYDVDLMNKEYFEEKTKNLFVTKSKEQATEKEVIVHSNSAAVYDMDNDKFIFDKNGEEKLSPASITKILTAYIVCKYGSLDDSLVYSHSAITVKGSTDKGYTSPKVSTNIVKEGNSISVKDALYISILRSDNSTTVALEEYIEEKTGRNFIDIMNEEAKEMGANQSHFTNSYGKAEKDHYVTAKDMAKITAYIAENSSETLKIMGTNKYTLEDNQTTIEHETSELQESSEYYNKDVIGGKTGYTKDSGQTMITVYDANGKHFVIVTLKGVGTAKISGRQVKHLDAKALYDYSLKTLKNNKSKTR